jgi:hypothetical protein
MLFIILILVLLIVVLKMNEQTQENCSPCKKKEYLGDPELNVPVVTPNKTYLSEMVDSTFTDAQRLNHAAYSDKRRSNGDNTAQLWGTRTDIVYPRAFGIRPKRAVITDPYASQQYSQMGTPDLKEPETIRLY